MFYGEVWLLSSRSWSQQNFKLSRWYLLKHWIFYCQTCYSDASLWIRLSFKKIGLLWSRSGSQLQIILLKYAFLIYYLNCTSSGGLSCERLGCSDVVKDKATEKVQNSSEHSSGRYLLRCWPSISGGYLFTCWPVTKLGMVMQHHGPKCHARRLVCCRQV